MSWSRLLTPLLALAAVAKEAPDAQCPGAEDSVTLLAVQRGEAGAASGGRGAAEAENSTLPLPQWTHRAQLRDIDGCVLGPENVTDHPVLGSTILVINLDNRPDRWEGVMSSTGARELNQSRRAFERWPAVYLKSEDDLYAIRQPDLRERGLRKIRATTGDLSKQRDSNEESARRHFFAVLSCYLSHWTAMNHLFNMAHHPVKHPRLTGDTFLVMEDDWVIKSNIFKLLPYITASVRDPHWDVIRLDCWGQGGWSYGKMHPGMWPNKRVLRTRFRRDSNRFKGGFGGSHAILYRRDSLKKIAHYFSEANLRSADDMFWTPELQSYCVNWGVVKQLREFGSNVSQRVSGDEMDDAYFDYLRSSGVEARQLGQEPDNDEPFSWWKADLEVECKRRDSRKRGHR